LKLKTHIESYLRPDVDLVFVELLLVGWLLLLLELEVELDLTVDVLLLLLVLLWDLAVAFLLVDVEELLV
jgi:hypothetical protein